MKRNAQSIPSEAKGSALLAALCFCAVLGIALASYMGVCYHTLQTSSRNNFATHSFELAETGMEEALGALNRYGYDSSQDWSDWTITSTTATKTLSGFTLGNTATGTVAIAIENYNGRQNGLNPVLNVTGTTTLGDGTNVVRKLRATAKLAPMFVNAVGSTFSILTSGDPPVSGSTRGIRFNNGGTVDSLDSGLVAPSEEEQLAVFFSAIISSGNGITLSDTQVRGYIAAATETVENPDTPASLKLFYTSNAHVEGPLTPPSTQIDQTRLSSSPYQPAFEIKQPPGAVLPQAIPPGSATLGSSDPDAGEMVYSAADLIVTSETLTVEGKVVIVVSGDLSITGTAKIVVADGASLQIVLPEPFSRTLFIGGGGIENVSGKARNVAVFYAGKNPEINPEISTTAAFCGVVYAPNCNLDFIVSSDLVFTGSIVAKTVTFSGTPVIHYDLDLRKPTTKFSCLETPFTVSSWQEVLP
ncbi:MAG: hypothetical protein ABIZ81_15160 [Opitutaceae bacterium]